MIKLSLCLLLLLMGLNQFTQAQNYQPFRTGLTYHYIAQDSIYSMRIDTAKVVAGDSVFIFNQTVKPGIIRTGGCTGRNTYYHIQDNNQFGHWMKKLSNGDYIFHTAQGQDFLLKTQLSINSVWTMNNSLNLQATLISSAPETFNGIIDNVYTYNLNNGTQIKLSQHYGFVLAPNFTALVPNSDFNRRNLQMHKLPEAPSITSNSKSFLYYDFQPGDKFSFLYDTILVGFITTQTWEQNEVLTRKNSLSGDSIYYTVERKRLKKSTFPNYPQIITLTSPTITTWAISNSDLNQEDQLLTNGFLRSGANFHNQGTILVSTARSAIFNSRESYYYFNSQYNFSIPCYGFRKYFFLSNEYAYSPGLGKTGQWTTHSSTYTTNMVLEAYIKGNETYGVWPSLPQLYSQIMGSKAEKAPHAFSSYPNPFTSEISLQFNHSFSAGKASVSVSNVLGQEVLQREVIIKSGQENRLELGQLPKGIYVLKAEQNGKVFTTRLVKE